LAMLLTRRLDSDRYEVMLATGPHSGAEGSLLEEMRAQGLSVTVLPDLVRAPHPLHDLRAIRQLNRLVREFQPHVVHTHGSKPKLLAPWAAGGACGPVLDRPYPRLGMAPSPQQPGEALYVGASRLRVGTYDALVTTSDALRRQGLERGVGRASQYAVIRPAVDLQGFFPPTPEQREAARAELRLPPEAFVVISVTRLCEQKAPEDLIAAAAGVIAEHPRTHFLVAGSGPWLSRSAPT